MKPKVVITSIDNCPIFHWLSKNYKGAEFFAIQNGNRTKYEYEIRNRKRKYYLQHFFCFGNYEKERYAQFGHIVENFYPVGSLLAGYYKFHNKKNDKIKYDLCVVSTWKPYRPTEMKDFWKSANLMNTFLARYIREYNLSFAVLMRSSLGGDEERYFKDIYGTNIDVLGRVDTFSTYRGIDKSELIVGSLTTILCEAFGWGKKVLYCDFTGTNKYNDYDPVILFTNPNYDQFKKRLNRSRLMQQEEYNMRTKNYASYLMNYDPDCPPHVFIRKKILQYL